MNKTMKLTTIAAIVLGFSGLAAAQIDTASPTRSQVRAELQDARASGQMAAMHGEDSGSFWLASQTQAASEADLADAAPSDATGLAAALIGEDSGSAYLSATAPPSRRTRAQVQAEVIAARERGELHAMTGEDSGAAFLARQRAWVAALYAGPDIGPDQHHQADAPAAG